MTARIPADPGALAVFADALTEAGDVRGEYIALELAGKEREALRLFERHRAQWLGPLDVPDDITVEMEHGFAKSVRLYRMTRTALTRAIGHPVWRNVEALHFVGGVGRVFVRRGGQLPATRLILDPACAQVKVLTGLDGEVFTTLANAPKPLALEEISSETLPVPDDFRRSWSEARGLPALRRLTLIGVPTARPEIEWLVRSPLGQRLEMLSLVTFGGRADHLISQLVAAGRGPTVHLEHLIFGWEKRTPHLHLALDVLRVPLTHLLLELRQLDVPGLIRTYGGTPALTPLGWKQQLEALGFQRR